MPDGHAVHLRLRLGRRPRRPRRLAALDREPSTPRCGRTASCLSGAGTLERARRGRRVRVDRPDRRVARAAARARCDPTYSFVGAEPYQRAMMVEAGCSGLTRRGVPPRHAHPPACCRARRSSRRRATSRAPDGRRAARRGRLGRRRPRRRAPRARRRARLRRARRAGSTPSPATDDGVRAPRLPRLHPVLVQLVDVDPALAGPRRRARGSSACAPRSTTRRPAPTRTTSTRRCPTGRDAYYGDEPAAAQVGQARRRPRPRLQLRPVDPAGALSARAPEARRLGGSRGAGDARARRRPRRRGRRGPRAARAPRGGAPRRRCRRT